MLDQQHSRKNKVNLNDYDYRKDVENRLVINQLDSQDVAVLEEIIYNSIQFPIKDIQETLELNRDELMHSIEKLIPCELFTIEDDQITVNKEGRKHFESHLQRFEEDFSPGIEFVQSILKGVPIQILPNWYHVPKSSNSIFESLIEKYFHTPQLFERYLLELNFDDPILADIVDRVFQSKLLKVPATEIMAEFGLTQEQFEEYMLALEFNFVLFSKFEKVNETYIQMILPFHEWREYALFTRSTAPTSIDSNDDILAYRPKEFAFVEDMGSILETIMKKPLAVSQEEGEWSLAEEEMLAIAQQEASDQEELESVKGYLSHVIQKLIALNLAEVDEAELHSTEDAQDWLECDAEQRAFSTYKHPANQMMSRQFSASLNNERNIREIEKSIGRIVDSNWVYFDDFMKGLMIPLSESSKVELRKFGKTWKYNTPSYTDEERSFIEKTILEWLFESGIISTGTHDGKTCFRVTSLGKSLFGV